VHPREHGHCQIRVVVDDDFFLLIVQAVEPTRVLHQRAAPGDRQGQEQRVEAGVAVGRQGSMSADAMAEEEGARGGTK